MSDFDSNSLRIKLNLLEVIDFGAIYSISDFPFQIQPLKKAPLEIDDYSQTLKLFAHGNTGGIWISPIVDMAMRWIMEDEKYWKWNITYKTGLTTEIAIYSHDPTTLMICSKGDIVDIVFFENFHSAIAEISKNLGINEVEANTDVDTLDIIQPKSFINNVWSGVNGNENWATLEDIFRIQRFNWFCDFSIVERGNQQNLFYLAKDEKLLWKGIISKNELWHYSFSPISIKDLNFDLIGN